MEPTQITLDEMKKLVKQKFSEGYVYTSEPVHRLNELSNKLVESGYEVQVVKATDRMGIIIYKRGNARPRIA